MRSPLGFVLLTHREPRQIVRLVDRLQRLYGADVSIALHHDEGQCSLAGSSLPGVIRVEPRRTAWGTWSLVDATLAALRTLGAAGLPEYVALLSGSDYPVAPAARVLADLQGGGADAYLTAHPVRVWRRDRALRPGPCGFGVNEGANHQEVCFRRYYATSVGWGGLRHRVRSPLLAPLLSPFGRRFPAYAGEQWCTLGRRAVQALLASAVEHPALVRWFAERPIPDEAYVHTVLRNAPGLSVDGRNFRFVDWTHPGPRLLGREDLERIAVSGAHFARKFAPDDPALDALDERLALPAWREARRIAAG
jgi:hypothetical protein